MAEVFESVIRIDTGESEQSVKGLKKEISELRDYILKLDAGTEEYAQAVEKLQGDQRRLNEVMSLTKKEAVALDGSYDALVHRMSLLKKEWRATNDEARRNELGQQIAEINQQLKDFDASLGNFQREVGHYENAMNGLGNVTEDFGTAMRESMQSVEPVKAKFESVQKISAGLASGFAAVQGAVALLGIENENLEKTFVKLQASMALAQGIGGLGDLVEGVSKAKVAFAGLGGELKTVSKLMGKAGWIGLLVTAVGAVVGLTAHLVKQHREMKDGTRALKQYNSALGETFKTAAENASDAVTELLLYQRIATDSARSDDERNRAARKVLETLGETVNETSILNVKNGDYKKKVEELTAALIRQAQAEAMLEKIKERQTEIIAKQGELADAEADLANARANPVTRPVTSGGTGGPTSITPGTNVGDAERKVKQTQQELEQMKADFEVWVKNFMEDFSLDDIIPDDGGGKEEVKEKVMTQAEALALAYKQSMELLDQELENMPEIELPEMKMDMPEEGEMKKKVDILIAQAERLADRERTLNSISLEDDETKAQKDYEINLALQEKKLALLQEYYDKCTSDAESRLELEQMIADQEVAIDKAKYDEKERLRREDLARIDSFKDAIEDFKASWAELDTAGKVSAISQVTSAAFGAMGDVFSQAADMQEQSGELSEKEAEKVKNLRVAGATMDMLSGVVGAIASASSMGPEGWVLGAIQAAAITATGIMNINKIKNTDLNGGGTQTPSVPAQSTYASELPVTYTRQVTGASEVEELNRDQRVYILESDIQASNRRVEVRESESSF